jgi:hypothetical protein
MVRQTSIDVWAIQGKSHYKQFFNLGAALKNPWMALRRQLNKRNEQKTNYLPHNIQKHRVTPTGFRVVFVTIREPQLNKL